LIGFDLDKELEFMVKEDCNVWGMNFTEKEFNPEEEFISEALCFYRN